MLPSKAAALKARTDLQKYKSAVQAEVKALMGAKQATGGEQ